MNKKYDVTVAGNICLDIIPEIPETGIDTISKLFKPGKLVQVNSAKVSTGGPVSNTGIAMKKMKLNVAFMSRIGKDEFGELLIKRLAKNGEINGFTICEGERTSYTIAIAPPGIDRFYLHDPGTNDYFSSMDLDEKIISQSRIFHFGYPNLISSCYRNDGAELVRILKMARSAGAITSLDMSLPAPESAAGKINWKKFLKKILPFVDIFMPSIEEAFFMIDPEKYYQVKTIAASNDIIDFIEPADYSQLAEICLQLGSNIVALKTGHRGIYLRTKNLKKDFATSENIRINTQNWSNRELWCPAYYIEKIASATGSGDSAIAGFFAAMLKGKLVEETLKYANCLGFQNLHELDAISGVKNWDETTKMVLNEEKKLINIPLENNSWRWEDERKLWVGKNDRTF